MAELELPERLPRAEEAIVEERKVKDYLLDPEHIEGASKAVYFTSYGFSREAWQEMSKALYLHAKNQPVKECVEKRGANYWSLVGPLPSPNGKEPLVRTVWEVENDGVLRFITAYPE